MMFNYQINVEYLGTNYVGWQIQKNGISVQSIVQKALSKVLKSKINIVGSGRTDSGVHAKAQSANFFSKIEIKDKYKFLNSVNFFLKNKSVSIIKIKRKNINFHSRFSVKKKTYKYIILNRSTPSPINENRSWFIKKELKIDKMKIPYGKNVYGEQEIKAVVSQLNKTTQMGKSVKLFEEKVAK